MVTPDPATCDVHGVLLDVLGVGILLVGKSGVGKSECALSLISKGYKLIADDVVLVTRQKKGRLIGASQSILKHFIEIRGLGILNIEKMYGRRSVGNQKTIDLVLELVEPSPKIQFDRLGLDETTYLILDQKIAHHRVPVSAGHSLSVIVEAAAKNYKLKQKGYHASREFEKKLNRKLL